MAKVLDSVPVYHKDRFHFDKQLCRFTADVSDFNSESHFLGRLFDDACDVGFGIRSPLTGKVVYFSLSKTEQDDDGVLFWEFEAVVDHNSTLAGLKVVVFNT